MQTSERTSPEENECRTCLGAHNEAIHEATVSIRLWLREQIAYKTMTLEFHES